MKPFKPTYSLSLRACSLPLEQGGGAYPVAFGLGCNGAYSVVRTVEELISKLKGASDYVPVLATFSLGQAMHALSSWLSSQPCEVLAKGAEVPLTIKLLNDESLPWLVLWDLSQFESAPLQQLASDLAIDLGTFDQSLIRTPSTPLTPDEEHNLIAECKLVDNYIADFLAKNPDIKAEELAHSIITKTGVTRVKRKHLLGNLRPGKGKASNLQQWYKQNQREQAKSDDELYTMQACNRGGFAFVGAEHASKTYNFPDDSGFLVASYDAISQYPAQMVSHKFPEHFKPAKAELLQLDAQLVANTSLDYLLLNIWQPFEVAFYGAFEFKNLQVKDGIFSDNGIALLQWSRFNERLLVSKPDRESNVRAINALRYAGYKDSCTNPDYLFGKLISADSALLWLTELEFWLICQVYDFTSFEALQGYETAKFCRPTDLSILGVMHFYQAKQAAKGTEHYEQAKIELNSLYGIEATNEARPSALMTDSGIRFDETEGIANLPENPKAWYQFGSRVAALGRVAQVVNIMLAEPYINGVINGDTDSLKFIVHEENLGKLDNALARWGQALDIGKALTCERVERNYPEQFNELENIGYYDLEYITREYCAGWNKAYIYKSMDNLLNVTISGIRTSTEDIFKADINNTYTDLANELYKRYDFATVANLILGYNVTVDHSITKQVEHVIPDWGAKVSQVVTDYLGNSTRVDAPEIVAYRPLGMVIGNTIDRDTNKDMLRALQNNPELNFESVYIYWEPGQKPHLGRFTDWGLEREELY